MLRSCGLRYVSLRTLPLSLQSSRAVYNHVNLPRWVHLKLTTHNHLRGLQKESRDDAHRSVPLRKQLKAEAKERRAAGTLRCGKNKSGSADEKHGKWELTVGVEIHAQLNTDCKLFSRAATSINDHPNSHAALFDLAFPGCQPEFQTATLIPALRAAFALNCHIQRVSRFDRKHYIYQDQPAGYQITQYYEPFAKNGFISLSTYDGIAPEDGEGVKVGIKQIQMEQDTAKSLEQPASTNLLDFNRVSHPLIEIITLPQIHSPATAAACVKKIQAILQSVNAVTTGMEMGGLRADINVSVRPRGGEPGMHHYSGITGLGQRTEIKNLSSFKAVEDAIIAERDRQISVLESGGVIEGETRGWNVGSTETRKLRGKEGEVDYRYMPDPDLAPVVIGEEVIEKLRSTLPPTPDDLLKLLMEDPQYQLSAVDAKTLIELDDGERLDYFQDTVEILHILQLDRSEEKSAISLGRTVSNWVLHELGGLLSKSGLPWEVNKVSPQTLAEILDNNLKSKITGRTTKLLLAMIFEGDLRSVGQIIEDDNLLLRPLSREEYLELARTVMGKNAEMVAQIREKGQTGKIKWFVGQMMRAGEEGRVEAEKSEKILRELFLE